MIEIDAPPVPATLDVSVLPGFMLNIQKLLASRLWAKSTGDEFKAAVALWAAAWQQVPAGSLPNDQRELESHSRAGARWKKVAVVALHGFVLCRSDGLLYHPVVCADALRADKARQQRRDAIAKRYSKDPKAKPATAVATVVTAVVATAVALPNASRTTDTIQHDTEVKKEVEVMTRARASPDRELQAERNRVITHILDATGLLHDAKWIGDGVRINAWLTEGLDPDLDIIPCLRDVLARLPEPPRTLRYFDQALNRYHADRTEFDHHAGGTHGQPATQAQPERSAPDVAGVAARLRARLAAPVVDLPRADADPVPATGAGKQRG